MDDGTLANNINIIMSTTVIIIIIMICNLPIAIASNKMIKCWGSSNVPLGKAADGGESNVPLGKAAGGGGSNVPSGKAAGGGESNVPSGKAAGGGGAIPGTPSGKHSSQQWCNTPGCGNSLMPLAVAIKEVIGNNTIPTLLLESSRALFTSR